MIDEMWNLRSARLFEDLTDKEMSDILEMMTTRNYRRGAFLFYTGEVADCMFFLLEGMVKISYITLNGEDALRYGRARLQASSMYWSASSDLSLA